MLRELGPIVLLVFSSGGEPGTSARAEQQGAAPISFVNDVLPVLSKVGCSQGTCHGSASGKGGFKLSLRGFAPELDYPAIAREEWARRVNLVRPQESLMLRKPTLAVPHRGGRVLVPDSLEYRILLAWLRQGAPGPVPGEPRVVALAMEPAIAQRPDWRRPLAYRGTVTDRTSGKRYKIYGKACGLDCQCDAWAVEVPSGKKEDTP